MNHRHAIEGQPPSTFQPSSYHQSQYQHQHYQNNFHHHNHQHQHQQHQQQQQQHQQQPHFQDSPFATRHLQQALNVSGSPSSSSPVCSMTSPRSLSPAIMHADCATAIVSMASNPIRRNKTKKARTMFSNYQLTMLETTFQQSPYPDAYIRRSLATRLALDVARVQVWFQNRRAKWRKKAAVMVQHKQSMALIGIANDQRALP